MRRVWESEIRLRWWVESIDFISPHNLKSKQQREKKARVQTGESGGDDAFLADGVTDFGFQKIPWHQNTRIEFEGLGLGPSRTKPTLTKISFRFDWRMLLKLSSSRFRWIDGSNGRPLARQRSDVENWRGRLSKGRRVSRAKLPAADTLAFVA